MHNCHHFMKWKVAYWYQRRPQHSKIVYDWRLLSYECMAAQVETLHIDSILHDIYDTGCGVKE
jgi:hypothetical protein